MTMFCRAEQAEAVQKAKEARLQEQMQDLSLKQQHAADQQADAAR